MLADTSPRVAGPTPTLPAPPVEREGVRVDADDAPSVVGPATRTHCPTCDDWGLIVADDCPANTGRGPCDCQVCPACHAIGIEIVR